MASRIEVRHYARSTGLAGAHTVISSARDKKLMASLSERGSFEVDVARTDSVISSLTDGDYIQFRLDGTAVFTGVYDEDRSTLKHPKNEVQQTAKIRGVGLIAEWEDAVVRPPTAVESDLFGDVRYFDWSSNELDDTGWDSATVLHEQDSPVSDAKAGKPLGFPFPNVEWIWSTTHGGDYLYDPGISPFRGTFTLASAQSVALYMAADDGFVARLNGVDLGGSGKVNGWHTVWRADVDLPAGTHVLAVLAENYNREASTNSAGYIGAVVGIDSSGKDDNLISGSGTGTKTKHYPTPLPGFTVGHVIRLLLEENQAKGVLSGWTLNFSDTVDSDGVAWPTDQAFAFDVGRDLLSVLEEMAGAGHLEFTVSGSARTLNAYVTVNQMQLESGGGDNLLLETGDVLLLEESRASTASVATLTDYIEEQESDRIGQVTNSLVVRDAEGQFEVTNAASVTAYGNRWGFLSLGVVDDRVASTAAAQMQVDALANPRDRISVKLDGRLLNANALNPLINWTLNNYVTVPNRSGTAADFKVLAIAVTEDDNAHVTVVPTLNSRLDELEVRTARAVQRMQHGTLEGRSLVASEPQAAPSVRVRQASTQELEWAWVGGPIENAVNVANGPKRGSYNGKIILATYDWNDPPADSAVTIRWDIDGTTAFTHTLPVDTDPHREYPAHTYSRAQIIPTCTAADTVADGLTAVLTVLYFV